MAIGTATFSANQTTGGSATTSINVTAPAGITNGDMLYAFVSLGAQGITPTATGWTLDHTTSNAAYGRQANVYRKQASGEPGSYTFSHTSAISWNVLIVKLPGADSGAPIMTTGTSTTGSTSVPSPSLVNDTIGAWLFHFGTVRTSAATLVSAPGGMTLDNNALTAGGSNTRQIVAHEVLAATGATGTRTSTISTTQDSIGVSIIVRPAAVVALAVTPSSGSRDADRLALLIYDQPGGALLANWTGQAEVNEWLIGPHGFETCRFDVVLPLLAAYRFYDRPGLPHVELRDGLGLLVWEGRLEDVTLTNTGLTCTAFGYASALSDLPYTAVFSDTSLARWRDAAPDDGSTVATVKQERYQVDRNNRLFIGLTKGAAYTSTAPAYLVYVPPAQVTACSFSYNLTAPVGFRARLYAINQAMTSATVLWTATSTGAVLTGAPSLTFSATDRLLLELVNTGVVIGSYPAETATDFLKITNLRVKGTTSAAVYADEIVRALVTFVDGNGGLSTSTALLQMSPGLDLTDQVYEDANMADILNTIVGLGDNQTPPRVWEWGVLDGRRLHYRPRGAVGRNWTIDAREIEVRRSLSRLTNSVYSVYKNALSERVTTATSSDSRSVTRWGLTRRAALAVNTTSINQAQVQRDMALQDRATLRPDFEIAFDRVTDAAGALGRFTAMRPGDTITIKNLPPGISGGVLDQIRTFRVAAVTCKPKERQRCVVTPETYLPALETLLAQRSIGYQQSKNE